MKRDLKNYTSFDLSEKLYDSGIETETETYWHEHSESDSYFIEKRDFMSSDGLSTQLFPAYLASELGEILPHQIFIKMKLYLQLQKKHDHWYVGYWNNPVVFDVRYEEYREGKTLVEAMAKMAIFLKESKLI